MNDFKQWLCLLGACVCSILLVTPLCAQLEISGGLSRQADEIPLESALTKVDALLHRIGASSAIRSQVKWRLEKEVTPAGSRHYLIRTGDGKHFEVSSRSGMVTLFSDEKRQEDQLKRRMVRRSVRFASAADAKPYLESLGKNLSGRSDLVVRSITFKADGQVRDANASGYAGYTARSADGKFLIKISVDIVDGAPTFIYQHQKR